MSTDRQFATVEEFTSFVQDNFKEELLPFALEWTHATLSGWDDVIKGLRSGMAKSIARQVDRAFLYGENKMPPLKGFWEM